MANFLIISPTPFAPANAGNRARIINVINMLREFEHKVSFVHVEREPGDAARMSELLPDSFYSVPYSVVQKNRGFVQRVSRRVERKLRLDRAYQIPTDAWYIDTIGEFVNELLEREHFDVVMVEYVFFSKLLNSISNRYVKVIDTHDVFANRHRKYLAQNLTPVWFSCSPEDEVKGLNRADIVCAIQSEEAEYFRTQVNSDVVTLGHAPTATELPCNFDGACTIAYLGSNNPINRVSIAWFIEQVLPLVRASSEVDLVIGGSISKQFTPQEGISVLGEIEDLASFYAKAHVVINPAQFGTGLKIKSIEALAFGRPLVSTSIGVEGLEKAATPIWLEADSPELFAAAIVKFAQNCDFYRSSCRAALDYIRTYSRQAFSEFEDAVVRAIDEKSSQVEGFAEKL